MSSVVISGNTSGTITLDAPAVAGTTTLTLPATSGTIVTTTSGAITSAQLPAGSVLQVVSTTKTDTFTTTSTSFTTITGLTASITPSSSTSKILIIVSVTGSQEVNTNDAYIGLFRDSTQIALGDAAGSRIRSSFLLSTSNASWQATGSVNFLDSPSTTSAISYSVRARTPSTGTLYINRGQTDTDGAYGAGRTISTITVMEIKG
jgi:hypothetical protein